MKCTNCGNDVAGKFCENCGARVEQEPISTASVEESIPVTKVEQNSVPLTPVEETSKKTKKPFYKKWWFVAIAIVIVIAIFGNLFSGKSNNKNNTSSNSNEYSYSDISVGSLSISIPTYYNTKTVNSNNYEAFSNQNDAVLMIKYSPNSNITYDTLKKAGLNELTTAFESENWFDNCREVTQSEFDNNNAKGIDCSFNATRDNLDVKVDCLFVPSEADNSLYLIMLIVDPNTEYSYFDDFENIKDSIKINVSATASSMSTSTSTTTTTTTTTSATSTTVKTTKSETVNGMRKDFKEAMDSYESFMDEYVEFMKKYQSNPSDLSLLGSYASYLSKYSDMCSKFEKWESEDLNDTELAYYIDVQARVSKKLLTVA